jgi:elongation factor 4
MQVGERASIMEEVPLQRVRNFSIIAHIDHGKSTLADTILEMSGNITKQQKVNAPQILDSLQVERERGITVRAASASLFYELQKDGHEGEEGLVGKEGTYLLNLIDTPGHVDFSYAVAQSLQACEGCLLLVDSSQGVQAQTIANWAIAKEKGLDIIPVLTKIDLPHSSIERVAEEMENAFDIAKEEIICCSAKSGIGMKKLFPAIIKRIADPGGNPTGQMRAMLSQSWFDVFRGVICLVKVLDGSIRKGDKVATFHSQHCYEVQEVGVLMPERIQTSALTTGQVGYIICGIKGVRDVLLGDTFYCISPAAEQAKRGQMVAMMKAQRPFMTAAPGFAKIHPMVYAGVFPSMDGDINDLR